MASTSCMGPDDKETGEVMAERSDWPRDIDRSLNDGMFRQLRHYWTGRGYRIVYEDHGSRSRDAVAEYLGNCVAVSMTKGTAC